MSSLTRWVLAHKRIVVVFWVVLTIVGIAAAGPASKALEQKFSVPSKEGWETNVAIAKHYRGTGGDTAPLLSRSSRCRPGKTVDSPGVRAQTCARSTRASSRRCPARASPPTPRPATAPSSPTTAAPTFVIAYPRPDPNAAVRRQPGRREGSARARCAASRSPARRCT